MYPPDPNHIHNLDDIKRFPLEDGDLIIGGFPRSGTNWLQVMFSNLWDHWTTTRNADKKVPNLAGASPVDEHDFRAGFEGYASCIGVSGPRLMKCHLPRPLMPETWSEKGKVVYVTRNPKDVCISYFHLMTTVSQVGLPGTDNALRDYVTKFVKGDVPYGPYIENVLSWVEFDHPRLLKVAYEEAMRDTRAFLLKVIDFYGVPVAEERLEQVIRDTEFNAMKSGKMRNQINIPRSVQAISESGKPFMRKGTAGGWKNELTVAMNEEIDEGIMRPLTEHGVRFA